MKHHPLRIALFASGLLLSSSATWAAADSAMLANTCAGCHGTKGASAGPTIPNLAGISKDTMIESMEAYASGERKSTIMGRLAKGYSKEEIAAMADFFTKQPIHLPAQETDAAKVQAGAKLHEEYCEKCHEDNGKEDEDGSGILAGQWMPYLQFSFEDYASGARKATKKMKKKVDDMLKEHGEGSVEQIIHFYGSQK